MRSAVALAVALGLAGCASYEPPPVKTGEVCFRCARVVTDSRLAVQLLRTDGRLSAFRTPACLAKYLDDNEKADVKSIYVTDYATGEMFPVSRAKFVRVTVDPKTRERDFYAFKSTTAAANFAAQRFSSVVDWSAIRTMAAAAANSGE